MPSDNTISTNNGTCTIEVDDVHYDLPPIELQHLMMGYYRACVVAGAYELLKAAKEHETQLHDNSNYITILENS